MTPSHARSVVRRPVTSLSQTRVVTLDQSISIVLRQSDGRGMDGYDRGPERIWRHMPEGVRIDKAGRAVFHGDIGLSIGDSKKIMAALQNSVVNHEAETYALLRRVCHTFRPVKDYTTRRIRTVFGTVELNPRWMLCRECHPRWSVPSRR